MIVVAILLAGTSYAQQDRKIRDFETLEVAGAFDVILEKGSQPTLTLEGDDDELSNVTIDESGKTLRIKRKDGRRWRSYNAGKILLKITYVELSELRLSGASELEAVGPINSEVFELILSGASQVELELNANRLDSRIQGASTVRLKGEVGVHWVRIEGASTYRAADVKSDRVEISCQGASSAQVFATEELDANASGASSIRYYGNPAKVNNDASGASSIRKSS